MNRSMSHQTNRNEIKTLKLEILSKLKKGHNWKILQAGTENLSNPPPPPPDFGKEKLEILSKLKKGHNWKILQAGTENLSNPPPPILGRKTLSNPRF